MPPIMGAGVFILATLTQTDYLGIAMMNIIPALLFFTFVLLMVDLEAVRTGIRGLPEEEIPRVGEVLRRGWHFFVPLVVVVNEVLAQKLWPGLDPIGQRLAFEDQSLEVVGVVATGKYVMISEAPRPAFFLAYAQSYNQPVTLFIRTKIDPVTVLPEVRRVLQRLDPQLPIFNAQTMEEHLRTAAFGFMPFRMAAYLSGAQGLVGLLLAIMGVYVVVAYSVS